MRGEPNVTEVRTLAPAEMRGDPGRRATVRTGLCELCDSTMRGPPRWPSGKASASRAEDPEFEFHLREDFFGVESYQ